MGHQLLEDGVCGMVCHGPDAFDLDPQFHDIVFRAAFRQHSPSSEERSDAREVFEVFAPDGGVDVHHRQLALHKAGELDGMSECFAVYG